MSDMRLPRPTVREEFRERLRADLVNEAVALAEERRQRRRTLAERILSFTRILPFTMGRLRPIAVAATVALVLLAGTGAAAAGSLPGDPAFGLKRAAEEVQLALATSDDTKAGVLAELAQRRLDELTRAADRPDKAPTASAEYEAAVARFVSAVQALRAAPPGAKRDAVEKVVEAAREKHVQVLEELKDRLPEEAKHGMDRATEQHDKLAPPGKKAGERSPKPSERPGAGPGRSGEPRTAEPSRSPERPRATETPRGGRPSVTPTPTR